MKFSEVKEDQTFLYKSLRHQRIEECMIIASKTANAARIEGNGIVLCFIKDEEDVTDVSNVRLDFPDIFKDFR